MSHLVCLQSSPANHNHCSNTLQCGVHSQDYSQNYLLLTCSATKKYQNHPCEVGVKNNVYHHRIFFIYPHRKEHYITLLQCRRRGLFSESKLQLFPFNFLLVSGGSCKNNSDLNFQQHRRVGKIKKRRQGAALCLHLLRWR